MTKSSFVIRRLQSDEWSVYRELRLNALKLAPEAFATKFHEAVNLPDSEWQERTRKFSSDDKAVCFLAFQNEKAVGMVSCFINPQPEMVQMWVEPAARKKACAQDLVHELKSWVKKAGYAHLFATVNINNKAALQLYTKLGFIRHRQLGNDLQLSSNI